jgi:hypothetical protein
VIARQREDEFFRNVWNHSEDEFQASFDERRQLNPAELRLLEGVTKAFRAGQSDEAVGNTVRRLLNASDIRMLELLLQICGLTRNKILQDIKASAGEARRGLRLSSHLAIVQHAATWDVAGPYLAARLRRVLHPPEVENPEHLVFEALNQATWPGYIRQERAKRSGHEAEYRVATLLSNCGIPFEPAEKADNPLCRDAQFNGVSFDIIIPGVRGPLVCVKSTVHTANIGQYGESKDALEVDEARRMIDQMPASQRPTLVGFIDGIGFSSNIAGLRGVLEKSDEFCQFRTIWKLVVIACKRLGLRCTLAIAAATAKEHEQFLDRYRKTVDLIEPNPRFDGHLAGDVKVLVLD